MADRTQICANSRFLATFRSQPSFLYSCRLTLTSRILSQVYISVARYIVHVSRCTSVARRSGIGDATLARRLYKLCVLVQSTSLGGEWSLRQRSSVEETQSD